MEDGRFYDASEHAVQTVHLTGTMFQADSDATSRKSCGKQQVEREVGTDETLSHCLIGSDMGSVTAAKWIGDSPDFVRSSES
jgi:hypothetical protein